MKMKITRFERTRLISARALQLSLGAPMLVEPAKGMTVEDIARLELEKGVLPMAVLKEFPTGEIKRVEIS